MLYIHFLLPVNHLKSSAQLLPAVEGGKENGEMHFQTAEHRLSILEQLIYLALDHVSVSHNFIFAS